MAAWLSNVAGIIQLSSQMNKTLIAAHVLTFAHHLYIIMLGWLHSGTKLQDERGFRYLSVTSNWSWMEDSTLSDSSSCNCEGSISMYPCPGVLWLAFYANVLKSAVLHILRWLATWLREKECSESAFLIAAGHKLLNTGIGGITSATEQFVRQCRLHSLWIGQKLVRTETHIQHRTFCTINQSKDFKDWSSRVELEFVVSKFSLEHKPRQQVPPAGCRQREQMHPPLIQVESGLL